MQILFTLRFHTQILHVQIMKFACFGVNRLFLDTNNEAALENGEEINTNIYSYERIYLFRKIENYSNSLKWFFFSY